MSTFAMVHGAWHGAWCWDRLTPELEALAHRVVVMDLPIDDSSASFDDYADVVVPLVAQRIPVRRLVYLCAMPPIPPGCARSRRTRIECRVH
ncbi:alpha/beta fold hydrolase [Mycobacterium sp. IDR2000157661]|uniref:alpha/beta fold hydrolase n=1 Tax=Mycobacterium sp. IDR2000157661 TaxID=2867005 RepID=UPI001EED2361|nr:alpha/beta fold hydrolase [Mycobacterium sp. IDR2000157661]ULE35186.1 hypothetical protein K3G64_11830 [Mycobacterium sp. IDR2000157661]